MTSGPVDPQLHEVARRVFDLARAGDTEELVSYVDRRAPVNLTDEKGDTLLLLAAHHGHAGTVAALLARGADHARVNGRAGRRWPRRCSSSPPRPSATCSQPVPIRTWVGRAHGRRRSSSSSPR